MQNEKLASRTRQVYMAIVVLGVLLAIGVYGLAASVKGRASHYMEMDLVLFSQVQQVGLLLSEQERILYEYYATSESELYQTHYRQSAHRLNRLLADMAGSLMASDSLDEIEQLLSASSKSAAALDVNLASAWTDWDLAREQLKMISDYRRQIAPLLDEIDNAINRSVEQGYRSIIGLLEMTVWVVALFSLGIAAVSAYLGRYAARYIKLSNENETLALFPKRNPNPVIRIDAKGKLLYANPAADDLIEQLYPNDQGSMASFPAPLSEALALVSSGGELCAQTVLKLSDRFYAIQSHWIAEHQTYDLHVRDITQRHRAEQALEHQAYHHPVTGIGNRSYLEKTANQWIAQQQTFNAVMIDVTDFKLLSENFGLADALACIYSVGYFLQSSVQQYASVNSESDDVCLFHVADACFMVLVKTQGRLTA